MEINKKEMRRLYIALIIFFSFSLVSASNVIVNVNEDVGLIIDYPQIDFVKQDYSFNLTLLAYNISTGLEVQPDFCWILLENQEGGITLNASLQPSSRGHYYYIPESNFSTIGTYAFNLYCEAGDVGGFASGTYEVNPTGSILSVSNSIMYFLILLLISILAAFSTMKAITESVVEWKIFYICTSYLLLFTLTFLLWFFSSSYLYATPLLASIFWIAWLILAISFFPFLILVASYLLKKQGEALLEQDLKSDGFSDSDARTLSRKRKS